MRLSLCVEDYENERQPNYFSLLSAAKALIFTVDVLLPLSSPLQTLAQRPVASSSRGATPTAAREKPY